MDCINLYARLQPHKTAINDLALAKTWTYAELDVAVAKLAGYLLELGLARGERLACLAKNRAEVIALHIACERLGAIFVPLNWRLAVSEINEILADCQPRLFFSDQRNADFALKVLSIDSVFSDSAPCNALPSAPIDNQQTSLILYTSGTTGKPKGVMLSANNLSETAINFTLLGKVTSDSVFLCESPMFHVIGLVTSVRPPLLMGASLIISDGFIPERTLSRLGSAELAISHYFCVPQMANALKNEAGFSAQKFAGLTAIFTGGAPHPEAQIRFWLEQGIPIVDGYGMSEAGTVFGMPVDIDLIGLKAGCVGLHTHRVQVRLADDNEQVVSPNCAGEVQLKGANLTHGYWGKEQEFLACFTSDGWFKTGDIAVCDADGYYRIIDRKKDMFISGGENVYPAEVEAHVASHPHVVECALVGVPDEKWGEIGCLFVVPHKHINDLDLASVVTHLEGVIAKYKLPKRLVVVETLPRTSSGKVQKHVLRLKS